MRRNCSVHLTGVVQVVLASATLLAAGIVGVPVLAQGQRHSIDPAVAAIETAFAMPRIGRAADPEGWHGDEVGLPHPLAAADAARIRTVFALQQSGQIEQAARASAGLRDDPLLGEVLADRYLSPAARPDQQSLRQWLRRWDDLPDAGAIRHLLSDLSRGRATQPAPAAGPLQDAGQAASAPPEEADPAGDAFERNPLLDRTVQARLEQGDAGARSALRLVAATHPIDAFYAATLYAEIARRLFTSGDDELAIRTARTALRQSEGGIGLAAYVAGLAAWRQGQVPLAQSFFEQASRGTLIAASTRAGAAFWAARTHRRLHDEAGWRAWMRRASASSHTFYGMLAARMLEQETSPLAAAADRVAPGESQAPGTAVLGEIDVDAVAATPEGWRAFALLQVGQPARAEAALRQLWPRVQDDPALCRSIMLVARAAGMGGLSTQLAGILQARDVRPQDAGRFPVPRLHPRRGFIVNPALVYALTRLESNFDNRAVSGAGAHGLMQIMPVTANFVLGDERSFRGSSALHNPAFNLEVGQLYLTYLAGQDGTRGDLIRMLASYNAGPNALARWTEGAAAADHDPLLFIETLPVRETRDFVHRALSYLWIYAARMDLPAPSLDTLAQGEWPRFDDERKMATARPEIVAAAAR